MRKSFIAMLSLALAGTLTWVPQSYGATYGSVSHIHDVKVFGDRVLLNTHEGLYQYLVANSMKKISTPISLLRAPRVAVLIVC